ncbi:MAG: tyrosine--tRNA ligase, partial [Patescibacteria group bacterium]
FITTLLENPKTGEKMMSKSLGTGIFLDFDADQMYGALMSQPDENMKQLFTDCTRLELKEIEEILKTDNPRDAKMRLSFEIVKIYHGEKSAKSAEENFVLTFQKKGMPEDSVQVQISTATLLRDLLLQEKLVSSKTDFKRLVDKGAISILSEDNFIIQDQDFSCDRDMDIKIGKRRFLKVRKV